MSPCRKRLVGALVLACLSAAGGGLLSGCATASLERASARAARISPTTGRVMTNQDLRVVVPGAILGEAAYAEVNSAWLPMWYDTFRAQLFHLGLTRWDSRFDCNRFADVYTTLAQAHFSVEMFHSDTPAQALALGPFWYVRADGKGTHAVVQALTERGRIFIDPQTGLEVSLTPFEQQSGYVQMF